MASAGLESCGYMGTGRRLRGIWNGYFPCLVKIARVHEYGPTYVAS